MIVRLDEIVKIIQRLEFILNLLLFNFVDQGAGREVHAFQGTDDILDFLPRVMSLLKPTFSFFIYNRNH